MLDRIVEYIDNWCDTVCSMDDKSWSVSLASFCVRNVGVDEVVVMDPSIEMEEVCNNGSAFSFFEESILIFELSGFESSFSSFSVVFVSSAAGLSNGDGPVWVALPFDASRAASSAATKENNDENVDGSHGGGTDNKKRNKSSRTKNDGMEVEPNFILCVRPSLEVVSTVRV